MKGWEKNVVLYAETHAAGACPVCGKNNVTVQEHISGNRHSLTFRCRTAGPESILTARYRERADHS